MKFVKKPVVIDAFRCVQKEIIHTLEGDMIAHPGDWIITGLKGERYPCRHDIFKASYQTLSGMDVED